MDNRENFSLFQLLFTNDYYEQIQKSIEAIRIIIDNVKSINWQQIYDIFSNYSGKVKDSANKWASYGWVPNLPEYNLTDLLENLYAPNSQFEADDIMMNKIDNTMFCLLVDEITDYNTQAGLNSVLLKEAVKCFDNELYSACALLLFALIDSCFIIGQPKSGSKNRSLAKNAVSNVVDENKKKYSIVALTTKVIIEKLFLGANDFDYSREKGLNRNFISHGMNKYNPNKTDCIKLFVLLYNIDLLFNVDFFTWSNFQT